MEAIARALSLIQAQTVGQQRMVAVAGGTETIASLFLFTYYTFLAKKIYSANVWNE